MLPISLISSQLLGWLSVAWLPISWVDTDGRPVWKKKLSNQAEEENRRRRTGDEASSL